MFNGCVCLVTQFCLTLWGPWTVARQAPPSMEFSRQEYWSRFAISYSRGSSWPKEWTLISCGKCDTDPKISETSHFVQFFSSHSMISVELYFIEFTDFVFCYIKSAIKSHWSIFIYIFVLYNSRILFWFFCLLACLFLFCTDIPYCLTQYIYFNYLNWSSLDPTRDWPILSRECPGVSSGGVCRQWPTAESGALNTTVCEQAFWRRSPLQSLSLP